MATVSWEELLLPSPSMFSIEMSRYWSPPSQLLLLLLLALVFWLLKIISSNFKNLSDVFLTVWSMPITAMVWAGKLWRPSTPSPRSLGRAALSAFTSAPSNSPSNHWSGPSSWTSDWLRSICLLWQITRNLAKMFLSVLIMTALILILWYAIVCGRPSSIAETEPYPTILLSVTMTLRPTSSKRLPIASRKDLRKLCAKSPS